MSSMILNLHKNFCAFSLLLLSMTSEVAYAQETSCKSSDRFVCANFGTVNIINVQAANSLKPPFQSPKTTIVNLGHFNFKLLGCRSLQDKVQCDLTVINTTSLDRTLFVASQYHGGISSLALRNSIGNTTLIDSSGASYIAQAVSFAGNNASETGQSFFTVYSGTTPKLSVVFTGVDTPATVQRLDLAVGENTRNGIILGTLRYRTKSNSQTSSIDSPEDPQQPQSIPQLSPDQSQPPSNQPQPSSNQSNSQPSSGDVFQQVGGFLGRIGDVKRSLNNILH